MFKCTLEGLRKPVDTALMIKHKDLQSRRRNDKTSGRQQIHVPDPSGRICTGRPEGDNVSALAVHHGMLHCLSKPGHYQSVHSEFTQETQFTLNP